MSSQPYQTRTSAIGCMNWIQAKSYTALRFWKMTCTPLRCTSESRTRMLYSWAPCISLLVLLLIQRRFLSSTTRQDMEWMSSTKWLANIRSRLHRAGGPSRCFITFWTLRPSMPGSCTRRRLEQLSNAENTSWSSPTSWANRMLRVAPQTYELLQEIRSMKRTCKLEEQNAACVRCPNAMATRPVTLVQCARKLCVGFALHMRSPVAFALTVTAMTRMMTMSRTHLRRLWHVTPYKQPF